MKKPSIVLTRTMTWVFVVCMFLGSCSKENEKVYPKEKEQSLVQISTIDALMQGVFDGTTPLSALSGLGDFGIGTFNSLDGEMILLDGSFYQIKADGHVYRPDSTVKTPFVAVTYFSPEAKYKINASSYAALKVKIDSLMQTPNLFYAVRLHGTFKSVRTRSVPAQQKPYPLLVQVTATQPEFETQSVTGTLCGFYCPPFVAGINVVGFHLHFLSDDHSFGGHVLDFELQEGILSLDKINNFRLILPDEGEFLVSDLEGDLSRDMEKVEGK